MSERRWSSRLSWLALAILTPAAANAADWIDNLQAGGTFDTLKRLGLAVGVLFVGWLVAKLLSYLLFSLLCRTELDNKLAAALKLDVLLEGKKTKPNALERGVANIFFYILMLLVVVGALDMAELGAAAAPIASLVETVVGALPLIAKAALILTVAYFAGVILKKIVTVAFGRLDDRFAEASGTEESKQPFSKSAGSVVFWLVLLLGLGGAFESLQIEVVAEPLRKLFGQVISLLPALALGALVLVGGYILGRVARAIIRNLLKSVGFDALPARVKLERLFEKHPASDVVGLVAMALIVLHALIAALDKVGLTAVSQPLSTTIDQLWKVVPDLAVALVIVGVGVVLGRVVRTVAAGLLESVGFDGFLGRLGVDLSRFHKEDNQGCSCLDKPSGLAGLIAQIAIVLLALVQALDGLGLGVWSEMVRSFLNYTFLKVLIALVIVGGGIVLGNYVRDLVAGKAAPDDFGKRWVAGASRMAVLVFAFTMAIQQLEVAPTFVLLTFGLVFGALCLALALAFGLGGREVAAEVVKKQYGKAQKK